MSNKMWIPEVTANMLMLDFQDILDILRAYIEFMMLYMRRSSLLIFWQALVL